MKLALFVILMMPGLVYSGVIADKTRVIINEAKPYSELKLYNNSQYPSIIQVFVSESNDEKETEFLDASDVYMSPPIFKVEGGESQEVKIRYLGKLLPKNTEKVYYIHIIQTPPLTGHGRKNQLVITQRHIIKLFVRADDLKYSSSIDFDNLKFMLSKANKGYMLTFHNQSFFHLNILNVNGDVMPFSNASQLCEDSFVNIGMKNMMISPGEHYKFHIDKELDVDKLMGQCRLAVRIVAEHGGVVTKLVNIGVE